MKKGSVALSGIGLSALAIVAMSGTVQAKPPAEWTCSEWLQVPDHAKPHVVYFMAGVHKADQQTTAELTAKDFKQPPIAKITGECQKNQTENLWDAIVKHFYWSAMSIP